MTQNGGGPRVPAGPGGMAEDPRTGPPGVNPWIPSLASVLEKQNSSAPTGLTPPAGATGFTGLGNLSGAQSAQPAKPALYGARVMNDNAIPEFVMPTRRPRRRVNKQLVLLVALVLLAAGGGGGYWLYTKNKTDQSQQQSLQADAATVGRTLVMPAAGAGYHTRHLPAAAATEFTSAMSGLGTQVAAHTKYAMYTDANQPPVVMIAVQPQRNPALLHDMESTGVAHSVDEFTAGLARSYSMGGDGQVITQPQTVDAGSLGGAMRCLVVDAHGHTMVSCVWADRSYLCVTIVVGSTTVDQAARTTRELRATAEH